ncbi:MAG: FtsQ-type POTRA domain-containing protein [Clostridia bacterium]|nr:FtsQ-type POTRA domain-containing protein [Clostridia bacterium]
MSRSSDRRESRFFAGDEQELAQIKSKESLQKFQKHNRTRRHFSRLTYFVIFGVLTAVFVIICLAVFFRIKEIEIVGSSRYSKERILSITGIEEGLSLYEISNSDLEPLRGRLAYIKQARITRQLPHTLIINITEDEPRYMCELYGEYFILSDELRVLDRVFERSELDGMGLIELVFPEINSALVGYEIEFAAEVSERYVTAYIDALESSPLFSKTTAFDLRDRFNLALIASDIYLIDLGNGDELNTKLTAVAGMLENEVFSDGVPATIDANDPSQCPVIKNPNLVIEFDD